MSPRHRQTCPRPRQTCHALGRERHVSVKYRGAVSEARRGGRYTPTLGKARAALTEPRWGRGHPIRERKRRRRRRSSAIDRGIGSVARDLPLCASVAADRIGHRVSPSRLRPQHAPAPTHRPSRDQHDLHRCAGPSTQRELLKGPRRSRDYYTPALVSSACVHEGCRERAPRGSARLYVYPAGHHNVCRVRLFLSLNSEARAAVAVERDLIPTRPSRPRKIVRLNQRGIPRHCLSASFLVPDGVSDLSPALGSVPPNRRSGETENMARSGPPESMMSG